MNTSNFSSRIAAVLARGSLAVAMISLASCALPQLADNKPYVVPDGAAVDTLYSSSPDQAGHGKHTYSGSYADSRHVQGAGIDSHPRVEAARWFAEGLRGEARALSAERYPRLNLQAASGYAYTNGGSSSGSSRSSVSSSCGSGSYGGSCGKSTCSKCGGGSTAGSGGSMGSSWRARHEARLVLSQRVFDGRRLKYVEEAGLSRAAAADLTAHTVAQTVAIEYSTAHIDYLQARDITSLADRLVEAHRKMLAVTTDKLGRGLQSQADVDLVRSRLERSQSLLKTQQLLMNDAEVRFRSISGKSPNHVAAPPQPSRNQLAALKLDQNWEVKAANETLRSRQLENQAADRLKYPNVDIEVGARAGDGFYGVASADEEVQALLVFSWDILDGGFRQAEKYRTEAGIREAQSLVEASKLDVRQLWDLGRELRGKSGERLSELNGYVSNLGKAIDALEADYASSKQPVLNVLDMQDELFEAKAERVLEKYNMLRGGYAMLAASGELVKTLEHSGVPTTRQSTGTSLASTTSRFRKAATHVPAYATQPAKSVPGKTAAPATQSVPQPRNVRQTAHAQAPAVRDTRPSSQVIKRMVPATQQSPINRDSVYQRRNPYANPLGGFSGF